MFARFVAAIQKNLVVFLFFCILTTVFRLIFIGLFYGILPENAAENILLCLYYGFRLSMKSAGIITAICFFLFDLPAVFFKKWPADKLRTIICSFAAICFSVAFVIKIPYFRIFNYGFNQMILNGAEDDWKAILDTAIQSYGLLWRLPLAAVISAALISIFSKVSLLKTFSIPVKSPFSKYVCTFVLLLFIVAFSIFTRFGASFTYANGIDHSNAARLPSHLLNEAILDDGQALYRVWKSYSRIKDINKVSFSAAQLREKIKLLGGNFESDGFDEAFERTASAPLLDSAPGNVVLILGETYALWPFLPEFRKLALVPEGTKLTSAANSISTSLALPYGDGTMPTLNGFITGLPCTGLYENRRPESFKNKYKCGIGSLMKSLGYKTIFWYGGFGEWQNIKNFVLAQNFDKFICADSVKYTGGNSWGCPDDVLYNAVVDYIAKNNDPKTFHMILTTGNHPPFSMDITGRGFNKAAVSNALPASIANTEENLLQLGHIWYSDSAAGEFVEKIKHLCPDSIFVLTGDHAERFSFEEDVGLTANFAVPIIVHGKGIKKEWLPQNTTGCHMQIAPTLAELIAPEGFKYYSVMPGLFSYSGIICSPSVWAKDGKLFRCGQLHSDPDCERVNKLIQTAAEEASWRIINGNKIN